MFADIKQLSNNTTEQKDFAYRRNREHYMYGKDCALNELSLESSIQYSKSDRQTDNIMMGWQYGHWEFGRRR